MIRSYIGQNWQDLNDMGIISHHPACQGDKSGRPLSPEYTLF